MSMASSVTFWWYSLQSSLKIDQMGVTIKGMMITIEGQIQVQVKGMMTQIQGTAMLQEQGGIIMIN